MQLDLGPFHSGLGTPETFSSSLYSIIQLYVQHLSCLMLLLCLQANLYPRILAAMKPGATLGLSHGFLLGVLKNDGVDFRKDINVVLVAPKVQPFMSALLMTRRVLLHTTD